MTGRRQLLAAFGDDLRALQQEAGQPSLRELSALLRRAGTPYPRTTIDDKLAGRSAPDWEFVAAFVKACAAYRSRSGPSDETGVLAVDLARWRDRYLTLRQDLAAAARSARSARSAGSAQPHGAGSPRTDTPTGAGPENGAVSDHGEAGTGRTTRPPWQLPGPVAGFVGRGPEQDALERLIAQPGVGVPIAVLSGMAGAGKTALAVHWAHRERERFPDGALYVDLRGYDPEPPMSAQRALTGFLHALGVGAGEIPFDADEREALYRSTVAGRRILVLLDNASSAEQVRPLLPSHSGCAALVTSRDRLSGLVSRDGAVRVPVGPLPTADAAALLCRLIGSPEPGAEDPTAGVEDTSDIDDLLGLAGGLPLAVRILADSVASAPARDRHDIVEGVRAQRPSLPRLEATDDPRTDLGAVFSWSYRGLSAPAAATFRALALHPGTGADEHAIAAMLRTDRAATRAILTALADSNLVQPLASTRWGMHDLLREYAASLPDEQPGGERDVLLDGMFAHYRAATAAAIRLAYPEDAGASGSEHPADHDDLDGTAGVDGPGGWTLRDRLDALQWLEAERQSLVSSVALAARCGRTDDAIGLALTLWRHLDTAGHFADALEVERIALDCARSNADPAAEGTIRSRLGVAHFRTGRYQDALHELRAAVDAHGRAGDLAAVAGAHNTIGLVYTTVGNYRRAVAEFTRAHRLIQRTGFALGEGFCLDNLGRTHRLWGRLSQAVDCHERALVALRTAGSRTGQGQVLANLALADVIAGQYPRATERAGEALELCPRSTAPMGHAWAVEALARVALRLGRPREALDRLDSLIELQRTLGYEAGLADTLNVRGQAAAAAGDAAEAESIFRQAMACAGAEPMDRCGSLLGLAALAVDAGAAEQAVSYLDRAQEIAADLDLWCEQAEAARGLARAHRMIGDDAAAQRFSEQSLEWYRRIGILAHG